MIHRGPRTAAAYEPLSRRPHFSTSATSPEIVELVQWLRKGLTTAGLDAGPHTVASDLAPGGAAPS